MQATKLRIADNVGLVPAVHYFARLAAGLRAQNEQEQAIVTRAEAQERKLETRYRRARPTHTPRTREELRAS